MNNALYVSLAISTLLWSSFSFAALEITCKVPDSAASITIRHPAKPGNTSADQAPSVYEVKNSSGVVLGSGEIGRTQFERDDFLQTLVFAFESSDEFIVGVALDKIAVPSMDKLEPGTYSAKSDLFVVYGPADSDYLSGSTLDCELQYSNR